MTPVSPYGEALARSAASFLGVKFVLNGRDRTTGLDCVGLIAASMEQAGFSCWVPQGYRLRNSRAGHWFRFAQASGFDDANGKAMPGDIFLQSLGAGQHHLLLAYQEADFIHAHAGLKRVVRQRIDCSKNVIAHWRLLRPVSRRTPWPR